jgi:hypothetical protein
VIEKEREVYVYMWAGPDGLKVLSPIMLDLLSMALRSPVTPSPLLSGSEEATTVDDCTIAEKGLYLQPLPRGNSSAAGDLQPPPKLLPLFSVLSSTDRP